MKSRKWILTDSREKIWHETFRVTGADLGFPDVEFSIEKSLLKGGLSSGVEVVEVRNGDLAFSILPTRGMSIWKGDYQGMSLGWDSPVIGPVHPSFVNLQERGGLGWVQGFDEWIVRCGLGFNGAPGKDVVPDNNGNPCEIDLNLHGRIANLPAHFLSVEVELEPPHTLTVRGHVNESMLFAPQLLLQASIMTWPNSNRMAIEDTVVNTGATPAEFELLYHCNFGSPVLAGGSELLAPCRSVYPRDSRAVENVQEYATYLEPTDGYVEQVYWLELDADKTGETLAVLKHPAGHKAVAVRFNQKELPTLSLWKNTGARSDGYVTGIEPGTDFPNTRKFEREKGRLATLHAGGKFHCRVEIEAAARSEQVARLESEVERLRRRPAPEVSLVPNPDLSPR